MSQNLLAAAIIIDGLNELVYEMFVLKVHIITVK